MPPAGSTSDNTGVSSRRNRRHPCPLHHSDTDRAGAEPSAPAVSRIVPGVVARRITSPRPLNAGFRPGLEKPSGLLRTRFAGGAF